MQCTSLAGWTCGGPGSAPVRLPGLHLPRYSCRLASTRYASKLCSRHSVQTQLPLLLHGQYNWHMVRTRSHLYGLTHDFTVR